MKIEVKKYKWATALTFRNVKTQVDTIVLHHSASGPNLTPDQIHAEHLKLGWSGIGYHYVITPDGRIFTGRPITAVGSNVEKQNTHVIGICFVGNFHEGTAVPTALQIAAGNFVIDELFKIKRFAIKGHRDLMATACPGKNFPMAKFIRK